MTTSKARKLHHVRPQNKSCPAGGSDHLHQSEGQLKSATPRGVIVAPPSANTDHPPHPPIVLHRGFDTLALAVKANIPDDLFQYLEKEKERADEERRDVLIDFNGIQLHLKSHGGSGYRFIASGGDDGATWFFKKPNSKDPWGIRLNFGSYFMAVHGLGAAKAHVDHVLDRFGIRFTDTDISMSRADFCIDLLAPDFTLNPENFVMSSSTGRRDHIAMDDHVVSGKSGRTTSVTVGAIANRQIIIYDKRSEIMAHQKPYWWDIWNHTLRKLNDRPAPYDTLHRDQQAPMYCIPNVLDPADPSQSRVWRVELRAGKNLLKDTWGIRTWADLFDKFGDLCRHSGEVVRYTDPAPSDINRARWPNHPLWEIACAEMNDDLTEMRSGADPNPLKEVHREQHISTIFRNILGCSITLAALQGKMPVDLPDVIDGIARDMKDAVQTAPAKAEQQLREAKERYVFIQKPEGVG
jgi:hypothetical protein